jgi:glycerol-3-phosphate dehydrogenase
MMDHLGNHLKGKVKFVDKKINNFAEVNTKYIINATGNGARELNKDSNMVSVQGHLLMLKDQDIKAIDHMILVYFNEGKTKTGQKVKRSFYIFPKKLSNSQPADLGVIGGTFIENATAETPNEEEWDILLQGAKDFYGIK